MDDALCLLFRELERFGAENDARTTERQDKMLNITPETGELLAILAAGIKAQRIVEIGTSNGYSTLWLADAIRATNGKVVTVEVSAAKAEMARHNIHRAGLSPWVNQQVMEAGQFLRQQPPCEYELRCIPLTGVVVINKRLAHFVSGDLQKICDAERNRMVIA